MSATQLRFLFDTNVLVPAEPAAETDLANGSELAVQFYRMANELGHQICRHTAIESDFERDPNAKRRRLRRRAAQKYPEISTPMHPAVTAKLGNPTQGSNDWVDFMLISAVRHKAVHFLVSEDRRLRARAKRLGLEQFVLSVEEAIAVLKALFEIVPTAPPHVRAVVAFELNSDDPIWASFRDDYPDFDEWLGESMAQHRQAWVVADQDGEYAAVCIVKTGQTEIDGERHSKALKLCSFKVSERFVGHKLGELLLKTLFHYADENKFTAMYVTVFEKHKELVSLFEDFGFRIETDRTARDELVLTKPLSFGEAEIADLDALDFNVRYGPLAARVLGVPTYVVPIQPHFADLLFPEGGDQLSLPTLRELHPFGNGIRKAYLCRSPIKTITSGSNLIFYRSNTQRGAFAMGVSEGSLRSRETDEVAAYVGKRTVYSYQEIAEMCEQGEVLAILFRQVRVSIVPVRLDDMKQAGALKGPPQSITHVREAEASSWLGNQLLTAK